MDIFNRKKVKKLEQEEAIEILKGMIKSYIEADECGLSNNDFKHEIRAMQTVLNMLKEKDKEIEKYKNMIIEHKKQLRQSGIYGYDYDLKID